MKPFLVLALAGTLCGLASAQTETAPQTAPQIAVPDGATLLLMQHVRGDVMAWWIDPEHNERPEAAEPPPAALARFQVGNSALPPGVDRVQPLDAPNALAVFGTSEGVTTLRGTLAFLDRPLPQAQIQIEARFVIMTPDDVEQLGTPNDAAPDGSGIGFIRAANLEAKLKTLLTQKKAQAMASPPVLIANKTTTPLQAPTLITGAIGVQDDNGVFHPLFAPPTETQPDTKPSFAVQANQPLQVTPTLNPDGTITISVENEQKIGPNPPTTINLRDGETVALTIPSEQDQKPADKVMLVFLTVRGARSTAG